MMSGHQCTPGLSVLSGWRRCRFTFPTTRCAQVLRTESPQRPGQSTDNKVMFQVMSLARTLFSNPLSLASATRGVRPSERPCSARGECSTFNKDVSRIIVFCYFAAYIHDQWHSFGEGVIHIERGAKVVLFDHFTLRQTLIIIN